MLGYRITSLCATEIIILIYIVLLAISVSYVDEHEKPKLYLNSEYIIVYSMQSVLPLNLLKTDSFITILQSSVLTNECDHTMKLFLMKLRAWWNSALDKKRWVRGFQPEHLWLAIAL